MGRPCGLHQTSDRPDSPLPAGPLRAAQGAQRLMTTRPGPANAMLRLHVLGPFRLCDAANRPVSLRSRKAQALLALLAISPRGERTRVWLRDKLWSTSDERRSSTNLRQILFELRRDIGPMADRAIDFGPQTLSLRAGRVWVDHQAVESDPALFHSLGLNETTELLEGLDIGDPEFEDWLALERGLWADRAERLAEIRPPAPEPSRRALPAPTAEGSQTRRVSLALLKSVLHGADSLGLHLADRLVEGIANSIRELQPVRILDLRDQSGSIEDLLASASTEFYCRLRLLRIGDTVTLTFFVHRVSRMALEWSQSIQCRIDDLIAYDGRVIQGFVAQNVDRLVRTLLESLPEEQAEGEVLRSGYAAMNLIFRMNDDALTKAMTLLDQPEMGRSPLHAALRSYIASFHVGDNIGPYTDEARELLRRDIAGHMTPSPFNSIALASLGHVLGYVFHEFEASGAVLEQAIRLNPAQAFAWDHFALNKIYTGDFKAAQGAAERAAFLGAYSPISFSYETTLAMASTLAGDYDRAVIAARRALQIQPRSNAALRYLMIAQSARGERAEAEAVRDRLLILDPDFIDPEVQELRFGSKIVLNAQPVTTELRKLLDR